MERVNRDAKWRGQTEKGKVEWEIRGGKEGEEGRGGNGKRKWNFEREKGAGSNSGQLYGFDFAEVKEVQ